MVTPWRMLLSSVRILWLCRLGRSRELFWSTTKKFCTRGMLVFPIWCLSWYLPPLIATASMVGLDNAQHTRPQACGESQQGTAKEKPRNQGWHVPLVSLVVGHWGDKPWDATRGSSQTIEFASQSYCIRKRKLCEPYQWCQQCPRWNLPNSKCRGTI